MSGMSRIVYKWLFSMLQWNCIDLSFWRSVCGDMEHPNIMMQFYCIKEHNHLHAILGTPDTYLHCGEGLFFTISTLHRGKAKPQ